MRKSLRKSGCSVYTTSKMFCSQKRRMCAVQLLRVSVHERISAAAEDFLLRLEEGEEAAEIPALRALLTVRLTAAAEEIVALLEETVAEYEDRVERSEREICRQRRLLDAVLKPEVKLDRSDVQQLLVRKEEVPSEQQGWSPSLEQEDIPEPPRIKEEQEELWTNQGGEQLQELEEVKEEEEEEEDEDKGQSSQLHQRKTDNRGIMGGNCGETDTNVDLHNIDDKTSEFSVAEIEVSCDDWEETKEAQLGLNCPEKPFSCPKCGKTFNKNTLLETHMRMHMGETPLSCSVCGKKYTIYRYLIKHMDIHEKMEKQHSCSTGGVESLKCDESECDKRLCYSHHLKNDTGAHPEENLFSCSVCGRKFTQRGYLNQHMARHTGKFQFRCCVCDKRFAWRHDLKSHKCDSDSSQLHQNDTEEESEADSSSTEPESDSDKISDTSEPETKVGDDNEPHHDVSESITTNRLFICSECGNTFSNKENLKVHMRMHKEKKPVSCSYCEKRISEGEYLPNHAKVPTQEKRVLYCVCGKIFACHYNLKKGVCESSEEPVASSSRTLDSSELQIDCNRTSKSQSRLNSLKNQILKRVTSGNVAERPFGCYQCGKRFQRKRHLQEHLRIHTGEKPYGCAVCMKYFSCSGSLRKHQRIHTGEKPFSCSICGNRFTESGHLKVHMRTHTGEKPFGCSICGKGFTWRQSFINHIKYHTEKTREMK